MGTGAGGRAFVRVLAIALALAAAADGAGAASEPSSGGESSPASASEAAGSRLAALSPLPMAATRPEPFGWAAPGALPRPAEADRWQAVMQALAADRAALAGCRLDPERCPLAARHFLALVETARAKEGRARLGEVNRAVNLAIAYAHDLRRHGAPDVWSAPLATFADGRGDCEDYAIA